MVSVSGKLSPRTTTGPVGCFYRQFRVFPGPLTYQGAICYFSGLGAIV